MNFKHPNPSPYFPNYILYSGGARGGDSLFSMISHEFGIPTQYHIRPYGNEKNSSTVSSLGYDSYIAYEDNLNIAREEINRLLGIHYKDSYGSRLQLRNYFQVIKSESILAIAELNTSFSVNGGTNTAVQLGIRLGLPIYVLNISDELWSFYNYNKKIFEISSSLPVLTRKFTGIGSRTVENYNINKNGVWVPSEGYIGDDKRNRIIDNLRTVFEYSKLK